MLDLLGKRIKKIGTSYPWSVPSNAVLADLASYALVGCVALVFSLWHIRWLHTHIQAIMQKYRSPINTVHRTMKDTSYPAQFKHPKSMPPEMSSWLQHNWSIKPTQPSSPAKHMAPCTLAHFIVPGTCIIASVDTVLKRENILWKGGVPEDDGNRRECNDMGEALAGPVTIYIDQSPFRHIPSTCVTTMMILQATMDLRH